MKRIELFLKEFEKLTGEKLQYFGENRNSYIIPDTYKAGFLDICAGDLTFIDTDKKIKIELNNYTPQEFYHFCKVFYAW